MWYVGMPIRASVTFTVGGAATDPTTIALTVTDPSGVATTYTYALGQLIRSGVGAYYRDVTPTVAGTWHLRYVGTGTCAAVAEASVFVEPSRT